MKFQNVKMMETILICNQYDVYLNIDEDKAFLINCIDGCKQNMGTIKKRSIICLSEKNNLVSLHVNKV